MPRNRPGFCALGFVFLISLVVGTASAQQTRSTEVKRFEVVSVDGNKVVVKDKQGAQEITVPEEFRLTVDGKPVSVHDLKRGMKGTATITTTTTVTPVTVTEVRNGEVFRVLGNSIVLRGPKGLQMYTEGDVEKRGIKIFKNGRPVTFSDLHEGDKLSATIITEGPPKIVTERDVQARLSSPPPPAPVPAPEPAPATGAATQARPPATAAAPPDRRPVESAATPPTPAATATPPASSTAATPASATPTSSESTSSTGNPWLLFGGLGAAVIALILFLTTARRRQRS